MIEVKMEESHRLDDFKLSKRGRTKLANKKAVKKDLEEGRTLQEIAEFSDEAMNKFYEAAYQLLEGQKYLDAGNAFLFLVTLNPYHYEYWIGLGMAAQYCHDYEGAIDAYEMAAICHVDDPLPYFYLAKCLFANHDRDSTLQALEMTIETAGDNPEFAELKDNAIQAKTLLLRNEMQGF
jgi:type III secretion system low calcium response chaperone LcrH/SycD